MEVKSENSDDKSVKLNHWDYLCSGILLIAVLWFLACVVSSVILAGTIPLSEEDMNNASWLSYSSQTFLFGYLGKVVGGMICLFAVAACFVTKKIFTTLPGLLLGLSIILSTQEENLLRGSIWLESAKIGCFVETRECHQMLGIENSPKQSMYEEDRYGKHHAAWYMKEREKHLTTRALMGFAPGLGVLVSPLALLDREKLETEIQEQRARVEQIKNQYRVPM